MTIRTEDLTPGMKLDLEGDMYADPGRYISTFATDYAIVAEARPEPGAKGYIWVCFEEHAPVLFPPDHMVEVEDEA